MACILLGDYIKYDVKNGVMDNRPVVWLDIETLTVMGGETIYREYRFASYDNILDRTKSKTAWGHTYYFVPFHWAGEPIPGYARLYNHDDSRIIVSDDFFIHVPDDCYTPSPGEITREKVYFQNPPYRGAYYLGNFGGRSAASVIKQIQNYILGNQNVFRKKIGRKMFDLVQSAIRENNTFKIK